MKIRQLTAATLALSTLNFSSAHADHNSVWGEGWANMPNDIHDTRIDTLGSDGTEFRDFVRYGNGADSVNRFATDSSTMRGARGGMGGMAGGGMSRGGRR